MGRPPAPQCAGPNTRRRRPTPFLRRYDGRGNSKRELVADWHWVLGEEGYCRARRADRLRLLRGEEWPQRKRAESASNFIGRGAEDRARMQHHIPKGRYLFLAGRLARDVGADVGRRAGNI